MVVFGAPSSSAALYTFHRAPGALAWEQEEKVPAPLLNVVGAGDAYKVYMDDEVTSVFIAGCTCSYGGFSNNGRLLVYSRDADTETTTLVQELQGSGQQNSRFFSRSADLWNGTRIVVASTVGTYFFHHDDGGGTWVEQQVASGVPADSVSLYGDWAVAATGDGTGGTATVFRWDGATWNVTQTLTFTGSFFNPHAWLRLDVLVVGSGSNPSVNSGQSLTFRLDAGVVWVPAAVLQRPSPAAGDREAARNALTYSPGYNAVYAATAPGYGGGNEGAVFVYRRANETWTPTNALAPLQAPTPTGGSNFGDFGTALSSVAGEFLAVGHRVGGFATPGAVTLWQCTDAQFD